jgi:predicted phosphoribosyltransferase
MHQPFADRREAGAELALKLLHLAKRDDVVVLALPCGGVPVAFEVAEALGVPLEIFLVRQLGLPGHPALAMGAIASGGVRVLNEDVIRSYAVPDRVIEAVARQEERELERRELAYRRRREIISLRDKVAVLIDDGLATGSTMRAAVEAVRQHRPSRVVVAVPVGAQSTCDEFADVTDETICARTPEPFSAAGFWYQHFSQTSDDEVRYLLEKHERALGHAASYPLQ